MALSITSISHRQIIESHNMDTTKIQEIILNFTNYYIQIKRIIQIFTYMYLAPNLTIQQKGKENQSYFRFTLYL